MQPQSLSVRVVQVVIGSGGDALDLHGHQRGRGIVGGLIEIGLKLGENS